MDEEIKNTDETTDPGAAVPAEGETVDFAHVSDEVRKKAQYVRQVPIFSSLKPEDILKVAEIVEEVSMPGGQVIFREGDTGDAVYIVIDGKVKVTKAQEEGGERTLAVFRDGDFFGEMAVIEETPRTATAVVIEPCVLYRITKQNFGFVMRLNPGISLKIMRFMSERVRQSSASGKVAEKEAKIITLFSPKGGIGKSAVGVNLACALARNSDLKVLLLDLDLEFGDFDKMIRSEKKCQTIIDMLKEVQVMSLENMQPFFAKIKPNLHLLAAPDKPEEAELVQAQAVKEILEVVSGHFDFIIVDTATSFTETTLVAMDMAWKLVFMLGPDFSSLENSRRAINVLRNLEYSEEKICLVVNMMGGVEADLSQEDIEKFLKQKIFFTLPYDYKNVTPAIGEGQPYVDSRPNCKASVRLLELVNSLCRQNLAIPKAQDAEGIGGLLKGFFGK